MVGAGGPAAWVVLRQQSFSGESCPNDTNAESGGIEVCELFFAAGSAHCTTTGRGRDDGTNERGSKCFVHGSGVASEGGSIMEAMMMRYRARSPRDSSRQLERWSKGEW